MKKIILLAALTFASLGAFADIRVDQFSQKGIVDKIERFEFIQYIEQDYYRINATPTNALFLCMKLQYQYLVSYEYRDVNNQGHFDIRLMDLRPNLKRRGTVSIAIGATGKELTSIECGLDFDSRSGLRTIK